MCEVGEGPQPQGHGHVAVSVPLGCCDMRGRGQDALSHTRGFQQRPQLLTSCNYGNKVLLIGAPGYRPTSGYRSELGEEQRHPEKDGNTQ